MKFLPHRMEFLLIAGIVMIHFAWFAWPLILPASENERLVSTFNVDEGRHLRIVEYAVHWNMPALEEELENYAHAYGNLYFILALVPSALINFFTPVSEQQIIVILRLVSTLFGILTVLLVFLIAQRYFGRVTAWLSTLLLLMVPLEFLHQSTISHPDMTQLFFLVLGVFFCCLFIETSEPKWMIWASVSAGLAMATKYSGIFLLPIIWMTIIVQTISGKERPQPNINRSRFLLYARLVIAFLGMIGITVGIVITPDFFDKYLLVGERTIQNTPYIQTLKMARIISISGGAGLLLFSLLKTVWSTFEENTKLFHILRKIAFSIITFAFVFSIASPLSLKGLNLLKGLVKQSIHTKYGIGMIPDSSGLGWFEILASHHFLNISIFCLAIIGLIVTVYHFVKRGPKRFIGPKDILWIWIIFYLGFLILRVSRHELRYILPVVPFLMIFGAYAIDLWIDYAARKKSKKLLLAASVLILLPLGGFQLSKSLDYMLKYRYRISHEVQESGAVKAGNWLSENYPATVRILYDHYSYIPPVFRDVHPTFGGTITLLDELNPDLVVVSEEIANRYLENIENASRYSKGEEVFRRRYEYYVALKNGTLNYRLMRDFGDVQVYQRQ